jgi:hypothetical protein
LQTAMEQMWVSMEALRRDKSAALSREEAAAADSRRAVVADESLQLLLAALVRAGRLEAAATELTDTTRLPGQSNSVWAWSGRAQAEEEALQVGASEHDARQRDTHRERDAVRE